MKKLLVSLWAVGLGFFALPSLAVIDTTAALAGITDAQTAILAIVGGLLALSVSVLGMAKVLRFVSRRAGA